MSRTTLIVLSIVSYVFFPILKIDASPITKNVSILDEIKNDTEICETRSVFYDSRYVKSCHDYNFSANVKEELSNENAKKFLCLGFYQRTFQICYLNSLLKQANNTDVPENSKVFDTRVENSIPKSSTFCTNWKHPNMTMYKKVKDYVEQLEKTLSNPDHCERMCLTYTDEIEPLCLLLASMDEISNKLLIKKKQLEIKQKASNSENANAKNPQAVVPEPPNKAVHKENPESKTVKGSKTETVQISETVPQELAANKKSGVKQQTNPTLDKKLPEPETKKPEAAEPADIKTDIVQGPKESSAVKPNVNKPTQAISKPVVMDKQKDKPTSSKDPLDNRPQTSENEAPAHDNGQEDFDKNASIEQEDENTDVISQHTQDDDITESPIEATHEEDANENSVQPQEKYSYGPRLPGIQDDDDSHFFGYFTVIGVICIAGYVGYHNKQKIFAMVLEGRRSRGGRGRRRPSTANYRKLDCTLEEAVTSQCNSNVTHVIY
ncbi:trans-Golgi network integral membrane protein 2-like isoform X2 [Venturia canescens]|uniref:trans-Golgi network integral membrane protein 2-like isoform X2 n=1 Tax=Venturia canescens TaxID=32260 RepID=UPI001C9C0CC2|nr:trans-Golgi network integral membrane protein 2-like isoform X2 [Venturia canescens]